MGLTVRFTAGHRQDLRGAHDRDPAAAAAPDHAEPADPRRARPAHRLRRAPAGRTAHRDAHRGELRHEPGAGPRGPARTGDDRPGGDQAAPRHGNLGGGTRAGRVVRSAELFGSTPTRYGNERGLILRGSSAYVSTAGSLWHVDTRTWRPTELADGGVSYLAEDDDGRLYFARGARLHRWTETT